MKKIIYIFLCLLPSLSRAQDKIVIVNGTTDIKVPTKIHVLYYNKFNTTRLYDSVEVVNGKFSLSVPLSGIAAPVNMIATYENKGIQQESVNDAKLFFVDKDGATIHIKDKVATAEITNSRIEKEKDQYVKYLYQPEAKAANLGQLNGVSPMIFGLGEAPADSLAIPSFLEKYKSSKALEDKQNKFLEIRRTRLPEFMKINPDSYFCFSALEELIRAGKDFDKIPQYIAGLSDRLRKSKEAAYIENMLAQAKADKLNPGQTAAKRKAATVNPLSAGAMAPDFTQVDINGKPVKLSDFKGKYVLVDFWASWCVPCRQENPNVVKAYQQFENKNFTVLGVALERKGSKDAWLAAIKKDGLNWTQVADFEKEENPAAKAFGVSGIPFSFLIDPTGKIIATNLRGDALLDKLTEILSN